MQRKPVVPSGNKLLGLVNLKIAGKRIVVMSTD